MAELKELLERVQKATGASISLERDIRAALEPQHPGLPAYTSLVDAALALVERVLPGWCGEIGWLSDGRGACSLSPRPWQEERGESVEGAGGQYASAATRPLAVCAALLSALVAQEQKEEG